MKHLVYDVNLSDFIMVCLFQSNKNKWNNRTDAKENAFARLLLQRPVTANFMIMYAAARKRHKKSKHSTFRHTRNMEKIA